MLVVSAVEGVQAQTRILMRALRRLNIATITFINKIDRHGANPERVLEEMAGRLIPNVVAMGSVSNPGTKQARFNPFGPDDADFRTHLIDMLTIHDERIVTAFVEDEASLPFRMLRQKLREQVNRSLVVPVFFGSAITGQGIQGFVSRCLVRLDAALTTAGFEDALKGALRAADVLGTDETPAPLTTAAASAEGCGNPHVYTVRTLHGWTGGGSDLIWYGAAGNRTKAAITGFAILDGYAGILVRDDYGGYLSYDARLAGVQQCLARLHRYLDDAYAIDPVSQVWTRQAGDALREAGAAVRAARADGQASLDPDLLARLRHSYDQAVAYGISVNLSRPWHKGNHPGLVLARRLKRKAAQVWLFATRFDVPATNNGSENAVRGYKVAAKISGCWRTLATLQRHCRIRSYLATARSHGRHPLAAIRDALTGNCWMPPNPA